MARLLLVLVALIVLLAGLLVLVPVALMAGVTGLLAFAAAVVGGFGSKFVDLTDPAVVALARQGMLAAGIMAGLAVALGFAGALATWRAGTGFRIVMGALAVLVLMAPAVSYTLPIPAHSVPGDFLPFGCALARGAAVSLLLLMAGLGRVPAGLRRAAMLAGARPGQAWRHAVLAPLAPYLAVALLAALAACLAEGPAGTLVAPYLNLALAWLVPAALLLIAGSLTALAALLQRGQANL